MTPWGSWPEPPSQSGSVLPESVFWLRHKAPKLRLMSVRVLLAFVFVCFHSLFGKPFFLGGGWISHRVQALNPHHNTLIPSALRDVIFTSHDPYVPEATLGSRQVQGLCLCVET